MTRNAALAISDRKSQSLIQCRKEIDTLKNLVNRMMKLKMDHIQDPLLIRDLKRGFRAAKMPVPSKVQSMRPPTLNQ